ncbi:MAG: hypothetical protein JWQ87_727 [Candidatus Sulfotelmatobacter sp.]|nr:hypothetical protein [Candidatus Sulfotelmatobacter sp.]
MKTTLFAFALVAALSLSAVAANSQKPAPSIHRAGDSSAQLPQANGFPSTPPPLCRPCLFYGGDISTSNPNAAGMSDENTLLIVGGGYTYGAVTIPAGVTGHVYGIVFNIQADAAFDPLTATYDIRTGVSENNGGTSLASGSGNAIVQATGRNFLGLNEYSVEVSFPTVTLTPGTYWFNVEPQCLNTLDGSCNVFRQFVSNSNLANQINGTWQPVHQMYLNSSFFGFDFANWCDASVAGFNSIQCAGMSFGLRGTE